MYQNIELVVLCSARRVRASVQRALPAAHAPPRHQPAGMCPRPSASIPPCVPV